MTFFLTLKILYNEIIVIVYFHFKVFSKWEKCYDFDQLLSNHFLASCVWYTSERHGTSDRICSRNIKEPTGSDRAEVIREFIKEFPQSDLRTTITPLYLYNR